MIREIINFTNNLIEDIPDIMEWKVQPSKGLHIFIDLDESGRWINNNPQKEDFVFFHSEENANIKELIKYENKGKRVGTTMNKVLDKKKQILSCSPFIVSFKKRSYTNDKLDGTGAYKLINLFPDYFENARQVCLNDEKLIQYSISFENVCSQVLLYINNYNILMNKAGQEVKIPVFGLLKDNDYINIYLRNIDLDSYDNAHDNYLKQKLFNDNKYNSDKIITNNTYGLSNFINGLNAKKIFLEHKTSSLYRGISTRITAKDASTLNNFEILLNNGTLPNPLPIIIDKREINKSIIKIFNENKDLSFPDLTIHFINYQTEYLYKKSINILLIYTYLLYLYWITLQSRGKCCGA